LPSADLFLYTYIRKEAVLSSQIEGTQSSLSDLLLFEIEEAPGSPIEDVREVSRYVDAMNRGLELVREGYPISVRVLKEMHRILLSKGRGSEKEPGELRRSQNWIGGTRPGNATYVPPPADYVLECLGELEKYLNGSQKEPALIKAALAHVQFESIHPFLDGNGRIGRLLITLVLWSEGLLKEPLLYLSLFFKRHRGEYYQYLQSVRLTGDWEAWLIFFLRGVRETADEAASTARALLNLASADETRIEALGRKASSALRIHRFLQRQPITTIAAMSKRAGLSIPTTTAALSQLQKLGIVHELTGRRRSRAFAYGAYLKALNA
jgi:Fic family protein